MLNEAKSEFLFKDLLLGFKEVQPKIYSEILEDPLKIDSYKKIESILMKMVRYSGQCEDQNPIIAFLDYVPNKSKSELPKPTSIIGMFAAQATGQSLGIQKEIDVNKSVVRVSCTCDDYTALYANANYTADAHHGYKPSPDIDGRDYGFKEAQPNKLLIPGVCKHLASLYQYLNRIEIIG